MLFPFSHHTRAILNKSTWSALRCPRHQATKTPLQKYKDETEQDYILSPATPLLQLHDIIVDFRSGEQFLVGLGRRFREGLQVLNAIVAEQEVPKILD